MKKRALKAVVILSVIAAITLYFMTPSPIAKDQKEVQIHWVHVLDSELEPQDITNRIDNQKLAEILCQYDRGRMPYRVGPYQTMDGEIEIGYFDHGELKHIILGNVNFVYESGHSGYKIQKSKELKNEIINMIEIPTRTTD